MMLARMRRTLLQKSTKVLTRSVRIELITCHRIMEYSNNAGALTLYMINVVDLEANIAREKYARICASFAEQFRLLEEQKTEKQLEAVCDQLVSDPTICRVRSCFIRH